MGARPLRRLALEGADQVHDVGVALDEHEVFDFDGAELGDAADVVAAEVDEHDVLGNFFGVGAEVFFEGAVRRLRSAPRARVPAMGRYSTREVVVGGGDADEEFGGGAYDVGGARCARGSRE